MADTNLDKLKRVLNEIFMLDQADLDFGIYRIMNTKRVEIERFLDNDLLPQVRKAFEQYQSSDSVGIKTELEKTIQQAKEMGVPDAEALPKVKDLRVKLAGAVDVEVVSAVRERPGLVTTRKDVVIEDACTQAAAE